LKRGLSSIISDQGAERLATTFKEVKYLSSDITYYEEIFGAEEELKERKRNLVMRVVEEFERRFNPRLDEEVYSFFVPGRVEVLGKHTDYAGGHSILFAMDRGFICISKANDLGLVRIRDVNPAYGERSFKVTSRLEPPIGDWGNYPMTVVKRLCLNFGEKFNGIDIVFGCDLPPAGGMSGSSALMIMTFFAFAAPNNIQDHPLFKKNIVTEGDLAMYLACIENGQSFKELVGERGVGTFGGSEDHTIILYGKRGMLSIYQFAPIVHKADVAFPKDLSFIILYSGVKAEKTGEAMYKYNLVSRRAKLVVEQYNKLYRTEHKVMRDIIEENKGLSFEELTEKVEKAASNYVERGIDLDLPGRFKQFYIEDRVIIPETAKAFIFQDYESLSNHINLSHENSKKYLWNIVDEIDFLQKESLNLGALASSGFGAGFGGSAYAVVEAGSEEKFIEKISKSYRGKFPKYSETSLFFKTYPFMGVIKLFSSEDHKPRTLQFF